MPALVVLDVMLPEVDGIAVLKAVRRTDRDAGHHPVGRGLVDDRIRACAAGADDYLPKPFSPAELVLRVERILEARGAAGGGAGVASAPASRSATPISSSIASATRSGSTAASCR